MNASHRAFFSQLFRYVGVGLISGSIVHMSTLGGNIWQYVALIIAGMIAFVIGTFLERSFETVATPTSYLGLSVALSLGIGMVSGAIQHYLDGPHFAAFLIAVGLFIGYIALFFRDYRGEVTTRQIGFLLLSVLAIGITLYAVAESLPHGHDSRHDH